MADNKQRKSSDLLPKYFRTVANEKFLSATLDQLISPGVVEKLDGYIGRRNSKAFKNTDNYISDVSQSRQDYQLEPALVIKDNLENVSHYADYRDYINSLRIRSADVSDHSVLNQQEYYSWNPHINWDMITNYREYYWLPNGPDSITVLGEPRDLDLSYDVFPVDNTDNSAYAFDRNNVNSNPTLTLYRGQTYTFNVDAPNMPFSIRTKNTTDTEFLYNNGLSENEVEQGVVTFEVPLNAPDYLFYVNGNSIEASGLIKIQNIEENSEINVEEEIIGKTSYTLNSGHKLSNGMKIKFDGIVLPEKYATGEYVVEGVGKSIQLINANDLKIQADYIEDRDVEFDANPFDKQPFDNALGYAGTKDYIVISRQSVDGNQWTRYNKWVHQDVLKTTAEILDIPFDVDQTSRAIRPIIEFEAGLKLFNFGSKSKTAVDLIDNFTKDVFSNVEGQLGYNIDGVDIVKGMRILFNADTDVRVNGKIYEVDILTINNQSQIALRETEDTDPLDNETVIVTNGLKNKGKIYYYSNSSWKEAQQKTQLNQPPLFDVFDNNGDSYSSYEASTFTGTKIFSYKVGTGTNDVELGFPIVYRTLENTGDITFSFDFEGQEFEYQDGTQVITESVSKGLLQQYINRENFDYRSAWVKAYRESVQPVVRQYDTSIQFNNFEIDVYNNAALINDIQVSVFVDDKKVLPSEYDIIDGSTKKYVQFLTDITEDQKLVIKTVSTAPKNDNGYYEFPINLQNNPNNEGIEEFTLGQINDHVKTITENNNAWTGEFPGTSNLRDLPNLSKFGTKFVQHSGLIGFASLHTTKKEYDITRAIRYAKTEYAKFKRNFIQTAENLGVDGSVETVVSQIIQRMMSEKTKNDAFYFSDMLAYEGYVTYEYTVIDEDNKYFSIGNPYSVDELNNRAVYVYKNGELLIKDKDYTFTTEGFVQLSIDIAEDDLITIRDYDSTDGCWIPPTPTKLGLYPAYYPKVYSDDTFILTDAESTGPWKFYGVKSQNMNEGNKLGWFYPLFTSEAEAIQYDNLNAGTGTVKAIEFEGSNKIFFMPNATKKEAVEDTTDFNAYPELVTVIQGHDGSIVKTYGDYRDGLILELEKRIHNNIKIKYDPSIFNIDDFEDTYNDPTKFTDQKVNPSLIIDFNQWLENAGSIDYSQHTFFNNLDGFTYNYAHATDPEGKPLRGFWRGIYKKYFGTDRPHLEPWVCLGIQNKPTWFNDVYGESPYTKNNKVLWEDLENGYIRDPENPRYSIKHRHKNLQKHIPVDVDGNLVAPSETGFAQGLISTRTGDSFKFGDQAPVETAWRRNSEYPFALIIAWLVNQPTKVFGLAFDRSRTVRNSAGELVYSETNKRIRLQDLVFPNIAEDDQRVYTSGLVNYMQGMLRGNSNYLYSVYKTDINNISYQLGFKLGGFTQQEKFKLILDSRTPYNEGNIFVPEENYNIFLNTSTPLERYSYSGVIVEKQSRGYTVRGYDRSSPAFRTYPVIKQQNDTTIRIGGISENFVTYQSNRIYEQGQLVQIGDSYYRVTVKHNTDESPNLEYFAKLPYLPETGGVSATFAKIFDKEIQEVPYGTLFPDVQGVVDFLLGYGAYLESQGFIFDTYNQAIGDVVTWKTSAKEFMFWSLQRWKAGTLITLSPGADKLEFESEYSVVDDIFDNFFDYSLLKADGKKFQPEFSGTIRDKSNKFGLATKNTADGIYHIKIPVVQKEHVVIIDNNTVFGDIIFDQPSGYRQERIKVLGYRSDEWNGGLNIPGFIYDSAVVTEWTAWKDYAIGDIVKYKAFYYTAITKIPGAASFQNSVWSRLPREPKAGLIPNFEYKTNQFADFYDLESDNFDIDQQRLAQHLIGYQKRKYLENIIPDSVSQFKFYQGFVRDKGTKNALTKLFDKLGSANKDSLEFFEEWAILNGQYGSTSGYEEFEIKINEEDMRLSPQPFTLVDRIDTQDTTLIKQLERKDIYLKPNNYDHKPFPTEYKFKDYINTAGYVTEEDVDFTVATYDDILSLNIDSVETGSYIWVGNVDNSWNVYKSSPTNVKVLSSTQSSSGFQITVDRIFDVKVGEIFGVVNTPFDKFYKVVSVELDKITVEGTGSENTDLEGFITILTPARISSPEELNQLVFDTKLYDKETVWLDDNGSGKWSVLENEKRFLADKEITNTSSVDFATSFDIDSNNANLVLGNPGVNDSSINTSNVNIYNRQTDFGPINLVSTINEPASLWTTNNDFGKSVAISTDGKYIAVGAPGASDVKSQFVGQYDPAITYNQGDIVKYTEELWLARRTVQPAEITSLNTFRSTAIVLDEKYDTITQAYPDIEYVIRGNYSFADEATNHVLFRAPSDMYEASKVGDKFNTVWNEFTTKTPLGYSPFNGDAVLNKQFFTKQHTIVDKIDVILLIDNTQAVPGVGDTITSTLGKGTVQYRFNNPDNKTLIYVKDVNGDFAETGELYSGIVFLGEYEKLFATEYTGYNGWWYVDVGTTFNSTEVAETNPNLIYKDFIKQEESTTPVDYYNIFDNLQTRSAIQVTPISHIETLSFIEGQTEIERLDTRWYFRSPVDADLEVGDTFRFYLNELKVNNIVQSPEAIGLTFDYLNGATHTVDDIWDGEIVVLYTNFDLQGNPFIPEVGDQVIDQTTNASATVTNVIRLFDRVKIFVKNATDGWSLGTDNDDISTCSFFLNDSTERLIGNIISSELATTNAGRAIVIDTGENIAVSPATVLEDLEYFVYFENTKSGITRTSTPPNRLNLDWTEVRNIPIDVSADPSGRTNEGVVGFFEKSGGLLYNTLGYYTVPDAVDGLQFGNQIKIRKNNNTYLALIHAKGNGTTTLPGKIYVYKKDADTDWLLNKDPNYRGVFDPTIDYYENELVLYSGEIYRLTTNLIAQPFNSQFWEVVTEASDVLGFMPNTSGIEIGDSTLNQTNLFAFGEKYDVSEDGQVLVVTVDYDPVNPVRKVAVYRLNNGRYQYSQLLESDLSEDENFGSDVSISNDGKVVFIGASRNDTINRANGAVYSYQQQNGTFVLSQTVYGPDQGLNVQFGSRVEYNNGTLAVGSVGGDIVNKTSFDGDQTSFDNKVTQFTQVDQDSGTIELYENYNNKFLYGQTLSYNKDVIFFADNFKIVNNHVYVGLTLYTEEVEDGNNINGKVIDFRKDKNTFMWSELRSPIDQVDISKFNGAFLYDTKTNELLTYVDILDPIQGAIAGPAEQEISIKTPYDIAQYNIVVDNTANEDTLNPTTDEFVGKIWWDISTAKFVNPYQGDIISSTNKFNKLFTGASIDIYEWVESTVIPSRWDARADTEAGIVAGISGKSLYGDNAYSSKRVYDTASKTFSTKYYFWVKGKKTIPNVPGRFVSAYDVSQYIQDPDSQNYKYLTMNSNSQFALHNCESLIRDNDIALSIRYWINENQQQNIHREYQIVTDGLKTSKPSKIVEDKWIDSLVGYDLQNRPVPDLNLSAKQKYGNQNVPRQSWFVNRKEALKQTIERINYVIKDILILDAYDISSLDDKDPAPAFAERKYDTTVDTVAELRFVNVSSAKPAVISPVIENGRIVDIVITDKGQGYTVAPTYKIIDSKGQDAELDITIDENGSIARVRILKSGKNYSNSARISIRKFSVLVNSDENIGGRWAIYSYSGTYSRVESQAYDVSLYWEYIDWYKTGYNQFTVINHTIDYAYQLDSINVTVGQVVKITSIGSGGWLLLRKVDDQENVDYTVNYETIGRQNGTIQFKQQIYDTLISNTGYDGISYDSQFYDVQPITELRIILDVVKNKIYINDLEIEWNKLFFVGLRYVFSEQNFVDWAFKTSFVKAKHNFGDLAQKITFQNDNLSSYEDYVNEAKPFKTKVREYVSSYEKTETNSIVATDFDLPPKYNAVLGKIHAPEVQVVDGEILTGIADISSYPNRHWAENVGFELTDIVIADSGSGYLSKPIIKIVGGGGSGAKAEAFIGAGKITNIKVTKPGSGYITPPEIIIEGSLDDDGSAGRAAAQLGNGKIRSAHVVVKFDRTTGNFLITTLDETETFTSQPNQQVFELKYPMNVISTNITVLVNGVEALRSQYTYDNKKDTTKGYDRYKGRILFNTAPNANSEITVQYKKGTELLDAQDRINLLYNPTTGQLANDLSQLMDGVDYGGVEVTSIDFGGGAGWNADRWNESAFDVFDTTYEDEVFVLDGSTSVFELNQPLENGVVYNVYLNGVRIDDEAWTSSEDSTSITNKNAKMRSITGDGTTTTVTIDEELIPTEAGDIIVIRKETSDGSFIPDPKSYDTLVDGGNLRYTTAKGINAEDINIDGDGFVTPTTSKGPEELVPGQVLDTVDIKVFHRVGTGGSEISSNVYSADSSVLTYKFDFLPQNKDALIVKVNGIVVSNYTVNYKDKTVTFDSALSNTDEINIISLTSNGNGILDIGTFETDGSTIVYESNVPYTEESNSYLSMDGEEPEYVVIETANNKIGFDFGLPPEEGKVINFAIYTGTEKTFSQIGIDTFTGDGSTSAFALSRIPFATIPLLSNIIVKKNNKILSAGYKEEFVISTAREYQLRTYQQPPGKLGSDDIVLLLNGEALVPAVDYIIRPFNSSVELFDGVGEDGDRLQIFVTADADYTLTVADTVATVTLNDAPADGDTVSIYNFAKHDVQAIERTRLDAVNRVTLTVGTDDHEEYHRLRNGLIKLDIKAKDSQYAWVTINGDLLTPNVDYYVTEDGNFVKILNEIADNDQIDIIQFGTTGITSNRFAFRQFKDIFNRTVYKRLGDDRAYRLAEDLSVFDNKIVLENAEGLPEPNSAINLPGVIFINSERIEYFVKEGNKLKQLTRGTLGTGVKHVHDAGSVVYNQGYTQTIPYKDETVQVKHTGDDSTNTFDLGYTPSSVNELEVFVGGKRLRKSAVKVFDITVNQDSPEGDVTVPAEFTVENSNLVLTRTPVLGESIIIVKKQGKLWTPLGESLEDVENSITRFLKSKEAELPE